MTPSHTRSIPLHHYHQRRLHYSQALRELVEGKYVRLGLADDPFGRSEVFGYIDFGSSDLPEVLLVKPLPGLLVEDDTTHKIYCDTVFHVACLPPPETMVRELARRVAERATYRFLMHPL